MPNLETSGVSDGGIVFCTATQGSSQWFAERAGAITGSMYPTIMDKYKTGKHKGEWKAAAHDYAFRLAIERLSGEALQDGQFETYPMRRGHELEPDAREAHEFAYGIKVEPCGFIKTDDGKFGVSADGLIGDKGGSEYKCFIAPEKLRAIHIDDDPGDALWQVQGGLWLTGREFWHLGLYCPALSACGKSLKVLEYERDEEAIEQLEQELVAFDRLVEEYRAKLASDQREAA